MTHVCRIRRYLPERYGTACRILVAARGPGPRNVLVEFSDGFRVVTTRWSVRKADPVTAQRGRRGH